MKSPRLLQARQPGTWGLHYLKLQIYKTKEKSRAAAGRQPGTWGLHYEKLEIYKVKNKFRAAASMQPGTWGLHSQSTILCKAPSHHEVINSELGGYRPISRLLTQAAGRQPGTWGYTSFNTFFMQSTKSSRGDKLGAWGLQVIWIYFSSSAQLHALYFE